MVTGAPGAREQGSAGLLTLTGGVLVAGATAVTGALVAGTVVHGNAQSAADLVAIAAAGQLLTRSDPCTAGTETAGRNGARLLSCTVAGARVTVSVAVPLPAVLRVVGRDEAQASAAAELRYDPDVWADTPG